MAVEPPFLMSYSVSGGTASFTPLATNATSAQALLVWVNLGPSYEMLPGGSTAKAGVYVAPAPIAPSTGVVLNRHVVDTSNPREGYAPLPQVGDRLLFLSPAMYSTGMPDTPTSGAPAGTITKPGRRITAVTAVGGGNLDPDDRTTAQFMVQLDLTNPLPTSNGKCTVTGPNSVYILREVAYAINVINGADGVPTECQLLRYPSTVDLTHPQVLIRDLDPLPQEIDANTGATIQPFNYYGGRGALSALNVNLPIRALDYAHNIGDRNLAVNQKVGTSTAELILRSNPTMSIKSRLDDNSLALIQPK